jgi:hypothetical protein
MRAYYCLAVILLLSALPQIAWANPAQDEGNVVSRSELLRDIPADEDHPIPRKLIAAHEEEISCEPAPQKILVAHYRAEPTAPLSFNDDRIVIAVNDDDEFRILKVLESETAFVDGKLCSDTDFEEEFISIGEMHFLYIRTRVMSDVYTISSDQKLSTIPFADVSKSAVLRGDEELRNGYVGFREGVFRFESGIYQVKDAGRCPSNGVFHVSFRLTGEFQQNAQTHVFEPQFKFVVDKEWRDR